MRSKNTAFYQKSTINCGGKIIDLHFPLVMAILNLTPDSFYDGGRYNNEKNLLLQAEKMLQEGAGWIDVGGMSSRPGATIIPEEEERKRVIPAIAMLARHFPDTILSIDTFRANIAREAVEAGACMVNDISAGKWDPELIPTVARLKLPYILMHMQGTPATMQQSPSYTNIVTEVMDFFVKEIACLRQSGIHDIIIDPGFGFGKTIEHNYALLSQLDYFKILNLPILAGISRKSMICQPLKINPKDALNGTTALNTLALLKGANILRVHDVKEAKEVIQIMRYYHGTIV